MQQDFRKHLRRQLDFLGRSAAAYDAGHADEAVRIATTIRILIHNTQSSTSLLKHLNATTISLMSSCRGAVPNAFLYMGLGMQSAQIDNGVVNTYGSHAAAICSDCWTIPHKCQSPVQRAFTESSPAP